MPSRPRVRARFAPYGTVCEQGGEGSTGSSKYRQERAQCFEGAACCAAISYTSEQINKKNTCLKRRIRGHDSFIDDNLDEMDAYNGEDNERGRARNWPLLC